MYKPSRIGLVEVDVAKLETATEALAVRFSHQHNDGALLAQRAGDKLTEGAHEDGVARIEQHIVTVRCERVSASDTLEAADELPASHDHVERARQISTDVRLVHVTVCASTKRFLDDVR